MLENLLHSRDLKFSTSDRHLPSLYFLYENEGLLIDYDVRCFSNDHRLIYNMESDPCEGVGKNLNYFFKKY